MDQHNKQSTNSEKNLEQSDKSPATGLAQLDRIELLKDSSGSQKEKASSSGSSIEFSDPYGKARGDSNRQGGEKPSVEQQSAGQPAFEQTKPSSEQQGAKPGIEQQASSPHKNQLDASDGHPAK